MLDFVVFDYNGVLVDREVLVVEVFCKMLVACGKLAPDLLLSAAKQMAWRGSAAP